MFLKSLSYIDGPSFSLYKPLQNVHFWKVSNIQFFVFRNCTHILTGTQGKVRGYVSCQIPNKGTSFTMNTFFDSPGRSDSIMNVLSSD